MRIQSKAQLVDQEGTQFPPKQKRALKRSTVPYGVQHKSPLPFSRTISRQCSLGSILVNSSTIPPSNFMCTTSSISACINAPGMSSVITFLLPMASIAANRTVYSVANWFQPLSSIFIESVCLHNLLPEPEIPQCPPSFYSGQVCSQQRSGYVPSVQLLQFSGHFIGACLAEELQSFAGRQLFSQEYEMFVVEHTVCVLTGCSSVLGSRLGASVFHVGGFVVGPFIVTRSWYVALSCSVHLVMSTAIMSLPTSVVSTPVVSPVVSTVTSSSRVPAASTPGQGCL